MIKNLKRWWMGVVFRYGWNMFVKQYGGWCAERFPDANVDTICTHMGREVLELHEAVSNGHNWVLQNREYGDVMMFLADLQYRYMNDAASGAIEKFRINELRQWRRDDNGCYVHIKSDEEITEKFYVENETDIHLQDRKY